MKYLSSAEDFFKQSPDSKLDQLRESLLTAPTQFWENLFNVDVPQFEARNQQEERAIVDHQMYLLETFTSISDINRNEALLIRNGYNPVFLTLEGAYLETVDLVQSIHEGLVDTVKNFVNAASEGEFGFNLGSLQFVLDILGLVPGKWVGFPIEIVANALNSMISFARGNFIMGLINGLMAIPGLAEAVIAPLKFVIKPFSLVASKLIGAVFKGGTSIKVAVEEAVKAMIAISPNAAAKGGVIELLGKALTQLGKFFSTTGAAIIKSISDLLGSKYCKLWNNPTERISKDR